MAILAAPTVEPIVTVRNRSELVPIRGPGLEFVVRCHRRVDAWSVFLARQLFRAICLVVSTVWSASTIVVAQSGRIVSLGLRDAAIIVSQAARYTWNTKRVKRWRRKVVFELMVVILGPGNLLIVIVLWPGWILVGAAIWLVRSCAGW